MSGLKHRLTRLQDRFGAGDDALSRIEQMILAGSGAEGPAGEQYRYLGSTLENLLAESFDGGAWPPARPDNAVGMPLEGEHPLLGAGPAIGRAPEILAPSQSNAPASETWARPDAAAQQVDPAERFRISVDWIEQRRGLRRRIDGYNPARIQ